MEKRSKMIIGITAGVLFVAIIVIAAVFMTSGNGSKKYAKHMETAQQYMDELQYEQAVAEYWAAIEIEPNNAEAYRALAEVYVQTGDYESAIAVLEQGIEQTESEELSECIEEVRVAQEVTEEAVLKEKQETSEAESAGENEQEEEPAEESGSREETVYNDDGSYWVYEYDENGNPEEFTGYNGDGTIYWVSEYDENRNRIE